MSTRLNCRSRILLASAVLLDCEPGAPPDQEGCIGAMLFDVDSIQVFDPIDVAGLRKIWSKVTCLGQAKWKLDPTGYPRFVSTLRDVKSAAP